MKRTIWEIIYWWHLSLVSCFVSLRRKWEYYLHSHHLFTFFIKWIIPTNFTKSAFCFLLIHHPLPTPLVLIHPPPLRVSVWQRERRLRLYQYTDCMETGLPDSPLPLLQLVRRTQPADDFSTATATATAAPVLVLTGYHLARWEEGRGAVGEIWRRWGTLHQFTWLKTTASGSRSRTDSVVHLGGCRGEAQAIARQVFAPRYGLLGSREL